MCTPPISYPTALKPNPSKEQALLIPADQSTNLIEYVIGLGLITDPQNIIAASKISKNRICIGWVLGLRRINEISDFERTL